MDFSIIIVNYNTEKLLKNCLNSLYDNLSQNNFEVIVVDNCSSEGKLEELKNFSRLRVIKNKRNYGFGRANNIGARQAGGKYLFFLNSDTIIKNDILKPIAEVFSQDKNIAVVSPKLILENGEEQKYAHGQFPGLFNIFLGKIKKIKLKNKNSKVITDWVSGAAMVVKKSIFDKIGGFDENFFMYFEDIDICRKIKALGYKIIYLKDSVVEHLSSGSPMVFKLRKKVYYNSQNYYYKKYYGWLGLLIMKILRQPYIVFLSIINK